VVDAEPEAGSAAPLLTVRLASEEGEEETLTLYPALGDGGDHPARSSARASGLLLPASAVTGLTEALEAVRNAEAEPPGSGSGDS
jgi:hypothetical protein